MCPSVPYFFFTCLTPDKYRQILLINGEALQLNGLMIIKKFTNIVTIMGRFTGGRGVKPHRISLTSLIKCSIPPKFCFTPPILCESL